MNSKSKTKLRGFRLPNSKPKGKRRRDVEGPIQVSIVEYLELQFPRAIIHHCRNELNFSGEAFKRDLAKAKEKGLKKGFPDLLMMLEDGRTIYFEVKAPRNYPDEDQKALHTAMRKLGHLVAVVRSVDDVRAALAEWGLIRCPPGVPG